MIFLLFFLLLNRYSSVVTAAPMDDVTDPVSAPTFRVMTFNTWNTGAHVRDGLYKIAKHIRYVYPDVVAIQEFHYATDVPKVLKLLGPEWSGVGKRAEQGYLDAAILTRHEMLTESWTSVASTPNDGPAEKNGAKKAVVRLKLKNYATPFTVNFWSLHLDYHDYGPYALCNKMVTKSAQVDAGEHYQGGDVPGRIENVQAIMSDPNFVYDLEQSKSKDGAPLLVLGDMNTPSHLDYTDAARDLHCGWAYQWPVTLALLGAGANLTDAYRYLYPDPVTQPGNTWSAAQKFQDGWGGTIPEPQDRIDMVLYKSPVLKPVRADIYSGTEVIQPEPYHANNDWPSDHASVVVDFLVNF